MISKNILDFWKPWCTSNIFTFEFECTLKTLIYFSMIPPLLLLGMITTMSGSSTLANWRELWTLLCLQNCCKKCTFNVYSNSCSPFLFVHVSETAVSICQAQPTYWGKKKNCILLHSSVCWEASWSLSSQLRKRLHELNCSPWNHFRCCSCVELHFSCMLT